MDVNTRKKKHSNIVETGESDKAGWVHVYSDISKWRVPSSSIRNAQKAKRQFFIFITTFILPIRSKHTFYLGIVRMPSILCEDSFQSFDATCIFTHCHADQCSIRVHGICTIPELTRYVKTEETREYITSEVESITYSTTTHHNK